MAFQPSSCRSLIGKYASLAPFAPEPPRRTSDAARPPSTERRLGRPEEGSSAISFEAGMFSPFDIAPVAVARQSPAKLWGRTPVILPAASKPNNKVVASPRGKMNFTI